ncbi:MAG: sigma-70 family RNA polymerase sigma factor, partial [Streptosporangiales bacterium]|nr:sigma-70 family RNA polymerase sigma factor [Streptosporangiales bacterium]
MGDSSYVGPMGMAGPAIIADAYDLYADQLYAYCRFFARDPADAVDALENIFLVAAGRGAALPLDGQLRTWLFAVARNECLRGIRTRRATPRPDRFPGGTAEGRARRELLTAASGGLVPGDRDLIAMLWHGLDADDMAAVLGIGREESFARLEAALGHLETAVTALLVARGGGRDCAVLARLLGRWNGGLDVPLVQRITRHAERCGRCLSRRQGELRPALRLSLAPAALLGAGVSAEALRPAAASVAELRDQVLAVACDPSAEGGEARRR